jgi:hypothetical protein
MIQAIRHRRGVATLLLSAAAAAGIIISSAVPGLTPWSASAETQAKAATTAATSCSVNYGALDPNDQTKVNPDKETTAAIGPRVTQRDEAGIKKELNERRTCGTNGKFDPELTATHYAAWSEAGLTEEKVTYADVDAFRAKIIADPTLYGKTVSELESLENASTFSTKSVSAGNWSVYAEGDGKGNLTTKIGRSSHNGTVAVFKHGDTTIEYRLECGFQVLRESQFPGVKACAYNDCGPKPKPTHKPTPPTTTTPPPTTTTPPTGCTSNCTPPPATCPPGQHGTPPLCKDSPTRDPYAQGNAPIGGGHNATNGPGTYTPPSEAASQQPPKHAYTPPPAPVASTPSTGGSGSGGGASSQPTHDPAPPPPAEPSAPPSSAPATGTSCAPGVTSC